MPGQMPVKFSPVLRSICQNAQAYYGPVASRLELKFFILRAVSLRSVDAIPNLNVPSRDLLFLVGRTFVRLQPFTNGFAGVLTIFGLGMGFVLAHRGTFL